jgi:hypothetical protein
VGELKGLEGTLLFQIRKWVLGGDLHGSGEPDQGFAVVFKMFNPADFGMIHE